MINLLCKRPYLCMTVDSGLNFQLATSRDNRFEFGRVVSKEPQNVSVVFMSGNQIIRFDREHRLSTA